MNRVLLTVAVTCAAQAHANFAPLSDALDTAGIGLATGVMAGGAVSAVASTVSMAGRHRAPGWFVSSYVLASLNLIAAAIWVHVGIEARTHRVFTPEGTSRLDPDWGSLAAAAGHAAIFLWNVIVASVGFARQDPGTPSIAPVVVSGRDLGGQRWVGVGIGVAGF